MGSDQQKFEVIFDTGSDWLALEDPNCDNCMDTVFNYTTSTTFQINDTDSTTELVYGSSDFLGYVGIDQVSFDGNADDTLQGFNFFMITD